MHIGEVLNGVYDEDIGWRPSSGAIKPVHVANGLVRALTGRVPDVTTLHEFVVWWKKGGVPDEGRSYAALVARDERGVYQSLAENAEAFDRARRFIEGLLCTDKAVFPSTDQSDLTLTCAQMASRSGNDRGLGDFGAALLRGAPESALLADAFVAAAESDVPLDPITAAVWPLLDAHARSRLLPPKAEKALQRAHNHDVVRALRAAARDLASHEQQQGNRLRTLERTVHFVCVATQVHAQALAAGGDLSSRMPLLVVMGGDRHRDLVAAGDQSLQMMYEEFEAWLADALAARIRSGKPLAGDRSVLQIDTLDARRIRAALRQIGVARKGHPEPGDDTLAQRLADFEAALREFGRDDPALVVGHTLVRCYVREYSSGGPRNFLRALERGTGLVYPHYQGRGMRRIRPSTAVLDMLVRACVADDEMVPLEDFLSRLWERFGLVVGGRRSPAWDDAEVLHDRGVSIDPDALLGNTDALVRQLEGMGLARRYADHVTFVGDANAG